MLGKAAAALAVLLLCSFSRGEHDEGLFTAPPKARPTETSIPPHNLYSVEPTSLTNSTAHHLNSSAVNNSATGEPSANGTLSHREKYNTDSTRSTEAPASAVTVAGTTVDQLTAGNGTSVPGNFTDSQEGSDLLPRENHTLSTIAALTATTLLTTQLPRTESQTSTSTPTKTLQTSTIPPTSHQSTTVTHVPATSSSQTTSTQTRRNSTSTKSTKAPTITMPQTTEASKPHSSTPVQAKARADTPSELNVGDDDSSASLDPLLAGLVSVFVVTAAIVSLLIFLKFRHRNERPEFRRLQDLPMDDMMEDTPLSMYSY